MANPSQRRIQKELENIKKHPPLEMSLGPVNENNLYTWEGVMNGPEKGPYSGGIFKFTVEFTFDYPMKPPHVKFLTKVFHPNISNGGEICIDILKKNWSSVYDISQVMVSICSLFDDPNCDDPFNSEAAQMYKNDRNGYNKKVKEWVKKYANPENL